MKRNQKVQADRIQKEKFVRRQFPVLTPMNDKQEDFLEAMKSETLVVGCGSSGTGKTLLACYHAAKQLHYGRVKKVVLIRAYQPLAGRTIGMLPGSALDKLLPFYQQMIDYMEDYLGKASTEIHIKNGTIEICSLETIRGRSWNNCCVVTDESQNLFVPEIQALVTRLGEGSQLILCGDNSGIQTDVRGSMDGLTYLYKLVDKYNIQDTSFTEFTRNEVVRSGLTKSFVCAFEDELIADKRGSAIISVQDQDKQFKKGR